MDGILNLQSFPVFWSLFHLFSTYNKLALSQTDQINDGLLNYTSCVKRVACEKAMEMASYIFLKELVYLDKIQRHTSV